MDQRVGVFRLDESATVHTPRLAVPLDGRPLRAQAAGSRAEGAPKRAASGGGRTRLADATALATAVQADADWKSSGSNEYQNVAPRQKMAAAVNLTVADPDREFASPTRTSKPLESSRTSMPGSVLAESSAI